jgi:hypothetical protein
MKSLKIQAGRSFGEAQAARSAYRGGSSRL